MTQRTQARGWIQWWQVGLLIAVASATLMLQLETARRVSPTAAQAVAQTTDAAQLEPVPSDLDTANLGTGADNPSDQPTDNGPAEVRYPHAGPIAGWPQDVNVVPPAPEAPLVAPVPVAEDQPDEEVTQRVEALLEQYDRLRQAMPEAGPPKEIATIPNGPSRMDSGDPDPDRIHSPPAHPMPSDGIGR